MAESSDQNTQSQARLKFECPFDLETVFTLQYSTEGLKGVLQWIIDNMGGIKGDLSNLDKLMK